MRFLIKIFLAGLVLILVAGGSLWWWASQPLTLRSAPLDFRIAAGSSLRTAIVQMKESGIEVNGFLLGHAFEEHGHGHRGGWLRAGCGRVARLGGGPTRSPSSVKLMRPSSCRIRKIFRSILSSSRRLWCWVRMVNLPL